MRMQILAMLPLFTLVPLALTSACSHDQHANSPTAGTENEPTGTVSNGASSGGSMFIGGGGTDTGSSSGGTNAGPMGGGTGGTSPMGGSNTGGTGP